MHYMIADEYGRCMTSTENLFLAGKEPLLEPREVNTSITSNEQYTRLIEPARIALFGGQVPVMPSDIETLPLLAKRPTMIKINGYAGFRLFGVEVIGESRDLGDYVAADQIRIVAELSPALVFDSVRLHERIMQVHTLGYGVRHTGDLCLSRKKLDEFEIALKDKLTAYAKLPEFKDERLDGKHGNQIFVQVLMRPFMKTELHADARTIIMNCISVVPTQMFALGLILGHDSNRNISDRDQNAREDVKKTDLISDIVYEVSENVFGTSF